MIQVQVIPVRMSFKDKNILDADKCLTNYKL